MTAETILKALYAEGTQGRLEVDGIQVAPADSRAHTFCLMGEPAQYPGDTANMCPNYKPNARRITTLCSTDVGAALVEVLEAARALANEPDDPALDGPLQGALDLLDALLSERGGGR